MVVVVGYVYDLARVTGRFKHFEAAAAEAYQLLAGETRDSLAPIA
jgi:hypothetical protein